jgi:hypothetical protein
MITRAIGRYRRAYPNIKNVRFIFETFVIHTTYSKLSVHPRCTHSIIVTWSPHTISPEIFNCAHPYNRDTLSGASGK